LTGGHTTQTLHVGFLDLERVREGRGLAALLRTFHALRELVTVAIHVLVDSALDQLGLLQSRHQRGVADLLLGGLMDLDRGLRSRHGIPR
jgi:hypothetical protein